MSGSGRSNDPRRGDRPHISIVPNSPWVLVNLREIWSYRSLLFRFAARDITLRYRQTALGVIWVVLQPLLAAGVLSFVFGRVADLDAPDGVPYYVFSLCGMVAWSAFAQVATRSSGSLVSNASLVSKVFFPRLMLPLSTVASTAVDVAISVALLATVMGIYGVGTRWTVFLAPLFLGACVLLALGLGMAAGALMVRYRDVQYVLPIAVQFLLYASPVAYALSAVPGGSAEFYKLNPLSGLLEGFRWSILGTPAPTGGAVTFALVATLGVFVVGLSLFSRFERQFADVI